MGLYVLSHDFVDTRSHDIGDMMSHDFVDTGLAGGPVMVDGMTNALSPRVRAMIINYDPAQPHALPVTEFCRSLKVSRSVFYKIRDRAASESTAALHPRSRAPKQPARRYGPDVVNAPGEDPQTAQTRWVGLRAPNDLLRGNDPRDFPWRCGAIGGDHSAAALQRRARRFGTEKASEVFLHPLCTVRGHGDVAVGCVRVPPHQRKKSSRFTRSLTMRPAMTWAPGRMPGMRTVPMRNWCSSARSKSTGTAGGPQR